MKTFFPSQVINFVFPTSQLPQLSPRKHKRALLDSNEWQMLLLFQDRK
jgi:hypothetical protein